jgi:hypothetical protein
MKVTPIRTNSHLLLRLQLDWERLARSRSALSHARSWVLATDRREPLRSLDELLVRTGYGSAVDFEAGDRALARLVELAARDQLAARVVLQRVLPGISALARHRARNGRSRQEALDEVVATAWTVIRTYPIDRRASFVAAGLIREIDYQSFKRARRRLTTFIPRPADTFDMSPAPIEARSSAEELRELLADAAAAGMDAADLELAERLARGETTKQIAEASDVTDRTIRNRRDALTYRLRAVALAS